MSDDIQELAAQLSSEDPSEREAAVMELAGVLDPQVAPLLLKALGDPEEPVRRWSAYGLVKLGRSQDAPILRRLLEKDPSTAVRIQAALGLARMGEQAALDKLLLFLDADTLSERRDAAGALVALSDPERLRSRLRPLVTGKDARRRAWAAGVLHALGDAEAFAQWRGTLVSPVSLRDAVSVVPVMREPLATRELLRLLAELTQEDLDAAKGEESPLGELMGDALRLSGPELLLASAPDEGFRADLLLLLGRYQHLIPELVGDIREFLLERFPEDLPRDAARLVSAQEQGERGLLFMSLAVVFPESAVSTVDVLAPAVREEVMGSVFQVAESLGGEDPTLLELCETLRASPHGQRSKSQSAARDSSMSTPTIEEMPAISMATPTIKEMPAVALPGTFVTTREMVAVDDDEPPEAPTGEYPLLEEEDEELEEDDDWSFQPPQAEDVAQRALVLGGLLRRLGLEERLAKGKDSAAKKELQRLQEWMEEEGLFGALGVTGMALLEAEPGTWSEEDRQGVAWSAEQLQILLWALKQGKLPPMETRVDPAPLLERLPLVQDSQSFLETAELRPLDEVEVQRDRWEVLLECARYESLARGILADESLAEEAAELDTLLESAEAEGFDRKAVEAKRGKARALVEGLRFWCRHLVTQLQQEGMLPGKPGEGLLFQGKRLMDLDEKGLATLLALAQGRCQALEWVAEGDPELPEDDEEFIEDDEEPIEDDEELSEDDEEPPEDDKNPFEDDDKTR